MKTFKALHILHIKMMKLKQKSTYLIPLLMGLCCILTAHAGGSKLPSLLPLPQSVRWEKNKFLLSKCKAIVVNDTLLMRQASILQKMLLQSGIKAKIVYKKKAAYAITLWKAETGAPLFTEEAYKLDVSTNGITLTAATSHGIFNGLQTLQQLIYGGYTVHGCSITDWPAYSWRGYMVDVGRNFQSVQQLEQQIDRMAKYKLNIFHFHFTEDIAWRLAIKQYPQLTAPENTMRNKGGFYSEADMKELIQYCRERFITLVPEIDMPGHSAAFTRAFGVDMQSEKGVAIIKNILNEFLETYHLPYFHIGADEVRITNQDFIPQIVSLIHSYGVEAIGWYPGGNYDDAVVRELWASSRMDNLRAKYIDAKNLYINHMDPLESVVSIFEKQLCDTVCGSAQKMGGEVCLWNDRRVADEKDLLRMNPVYPAMLAFAERAWRGGGYPGATVAIGDKGSDREKSFSEFENRLLAQKHQYFQNLPFPYVRQSNIQWKLFGPFDNDGNLSKSFWPENTNVSIADSAADKTVIGGTVYLRHWWFPVLQSWLAHPKQNTTWYAYRTIWKDKDEDGFMWIGFYNISTSNATGVPEKGTWDNRKSCIWLNGQLIPPHTFNMAGKHVSSESSLTDEGYSYRAPAKVHFKKGWNTILIKAPVGSFDDKGWQNPVKWMFTAVPVHKAEGINWDADDE